jgi:hypothetical protein
LSQDAHPVPQAVQAPAFKKKPDLQVVQASAAVQAAQLDPQAVHALSAKKNPAAHPVHSSTVQVKQFP